MPQRVIWLWAVLLGLAGLVLAAALVLLGKDLLRASQTGPRWKRRVLTAALLLLAWAGVTVTNTSCTMCYAPVPSWAHMEKDDFRQLLARLPGRLELLEKQIADRTVTPQVLDDTSQTIRRDAYTLRSEKAQELLSKDERAQAEALCKRADQLVARASEREKAVEGAK